MFTAIFQQCVLGKGAVIRFAFIAKQYKTGRLLPFRFSAFIRLQGAEKKQQKVENYFSKRSKWMLSEKQQMSLQKNSDYEIAITLSLIHI